MASVSPLYPNPLQPSVLLFPIPKLHLFFLVSFLDLPYLSNAHHVLIQGNMLPNQSVILDNKLCNLDWIFYQVYRSTKNLGKEFVGVTRNSNPPKVYTSLS